MAIQSGQEFKSGHMRDLGEHLQAIFENLAEGIITSDLNGKLLFWNHAAIEMHGFTGDDDLLLHFSKFSDFFELATIDGRIVKFEDWPLSRLLQGERLRNYDLRIRRLDKDQHTVLLACWVEWRHC